jgi:hypothetical protein
VFALVIFLGAVPYAFAQDAHPDDAVLRPAEPDFGLISLPTALRLPQGGSAFRLTHRFSLPLNHNTADEVFGRLLGIDSNAITGIEYRYGLLPNLQVGMHHSGDNRTWSFFGEYGVVRQGERVPADVSVFAAVDSPRVPVIGVANSFERHASPSVAVLVSRTFEEHLAVYVEPIVVSNIFNEFGTPSSSDKAFLVGLGGRVRVLPTVYLVAEVAPRVAGFSANTTHAAVGIEKRAGGHVFQLNMSNSFGTVMSQLAQGGESTNNWHLGFNLSRKFF